jgi:hypothetical protein
MSLEAECCDRERERGRTEGFLWGTHTGPAASSLLWRLSLVRASAARDAVSPSDTLIDSATPTRRGPPCNGDDTDRIELLSMFAIFENSTCKEFMCVGVESDV